MRRKIMETLLRTDDSHGGFSGDISTSPTSSARHRGVPLIETSSHDSKDNIFASFLDGRPFINSNPTMDADIESDLTPSSPSKRISLNITR
jgi:hypothetical protein